MPKIKFSNLFYFIIICLCTSSSFANEQFTNDSHHPFYIGIASGHGSTTWGALVPKDPNPALAVSTPIYVQEGGYSWGAFAGFEFIPQFALETAYTRFKKARLYFDPTYSVLSYDHDGQDEFATYTETVSIMGKIMLPIPHTRAKAYSSAGIGGVHRFDEIKSIWRIDPSFGLGFTYNISEHWMADLGFNYTAGYGESEINPANDFVPFVYTAMLRLAYRL